MYHITAVDLTRTSEDRSILLVYVTDDDERKVYSILIPFSLKVGQENASLEDIRVTEHFYEGMKPDQPPLDLTQDNPIHRRLVKYAKKVFLFLN